jgi:hypothetical protein
MSSAGAAVRLPGKVPAHEEVIGTYPTKKLADRALDALNKKKIREYKAAAIKAAPTGLSVSQAKDAWDRADRVLWMEDHAYGADDEVSLRAAIIGWGEIMAYGYSGRFFANYARLSPADAERLRQYEALRAVAYGLMWRWQNLREDAR